MAADTPLLDGDALLRASDVARRLNVAKPTLYEWARNNPDRYGAVRVGPRTVRFRAGVIDGLVGGENLHERA